MNKALSTQGRGSVELPPIPLAMEKLTTQQLAACCIERERWMAVSAGAGSGKTAVLANRMVALLESGAPLSTIVAITFTRKAAQEMATRVETLLSARVGELRRYRSEGGDHGEVERRLRALEGAREEFHRHRITTIDGFCRTQLASNALEAGLEPGFAVLDEHQGRQIEVGASDALRRMLTPYARRVVTEVGASPQRVREGEAYAELHRWFASKQVDEMLTGLLRRPGELQEALGDVGCWPLPTEAENVESAVLAQAERLLPALRTSIEQRLPWYELFPSIDGASDDPRREVARIGRAVLSDLRAIKQDSGAWVSYFATFVEACERDQLWGPEGSIALLGGLRGVGSKLRQDVLDCLDAHGVVRGNVTAMVNALKEVGASCDLDEQVERRSGRLLWALGTLQPVLFECYARLKAGALTFADLKRSMLDFVHPGPAREGMPERSVRQAAVNAQSVASGIEWMMIDEFQDTDPEQLRLFLRIVEASAERADGGINLFVVGDEKQSIYRFRGADAGVFRAAAERVGKQIQLKGLASRAIGHPMTGLTIEDRDGAGMTLDRTAASEGTVRLSANFRTDGVPLRVGNALYERIFGLLDETGEPVRDAQVWDCRAQNLERGKRNDDGTGAEGGFVELVPLTVHGMGSDEEPKEEPRDSGEPQARYADLAAALREARCVAQQVRRLLVEKKIDGWGDVAVLVRKNVEVDLVRAALAQDRIPCITTGGSALFRRQEVRDILSLCAALTDPNDDMAWLGLLRSPLFGVTDEGLLAVLKSGGGKRLAPISQFLLSAKAQEVWKPAVESLDAFRSNGGHAGAGDLGRLEAAASMIRMWRRRAVDARPTDVVRGALEECGAWAYGVGAGHAQRLANIELLLKLIGQKEAEGLGLAAIADWLREQIDEGAPHAEGRTDGQASGESGENEVSTGGASEPMEGSESVDVMTVHQAKGKQFKVVVLPYLCGRGGANYQSAYDVGKPPPSLAPMPYGMLAYVMTDAPSLSMDAQPAPVACRLLKLDIGMMERAELRRVFYTAWTRAEKGVVAILATKKPRATGGPRPAPDPEQSSLSAGDLVLAALGASPESGLMAEGLRAGIERLSNQHHAHAASARDARVKQFHEAHADALCAICIADEQVIEPPRVSPDLRRRALVGALARGVSIRDDRGRPLDVVSEMSPDALSLIQSLPEPSRVRRVPIPIVEEYGVLAPDSPRTVRAWTPRRSMVRSHPVAEAYGIVDARSAATRLADNEFGTIVHEVLRVEIRSGALGARTSSSESPQRVRRSVMGVTARLGFGADRDSGQIEELARHVEAGLRLLRTLGTPRRVLTELPLVVGSIERRLDCVFELADSEWMIVDFKTSPIDSGGTDAHAQQLREYAALLTHTLRAYDEAPTRVITAIAHTADDGQWSGQKEYRGEDLDVLAHEVEANALATR